MCHLRARTSGEQQNLKTKPKNNEQTFRVLVRNEDGIQTQDTRDKQKAKIYNENESTVEVEHQH